MDKAQEKIAEVLKTQVGARETGDNCYEIQPYWRGVLARKILEELCKLPEGKPELRERLVEWLYNELSIEKLITRDGTFTNDLEIRKEWAYEIVDQILALIPVEVYYARNRRD